MAKTSSFGSDTGLQARMVLTMFLLAVVYAVLIGALFAAGINGGLILVMGGGLLLFQLLASEKLALRAMGGREVSVQEAPEFHALIERLCIQADLPKPKVAIAHTSMPNAFALGRSRKDATVCATTGIMDILSPAELEGVMAHELSHIANRDVAIMTYASFFASLASMIVQFGFYFTGGHDDDDSGPSALALIAISAAVWIVSFLLMRALSRYREFGADRGAALITGRPSALSSALMKIDGRMAAIPTQDARTQEMAAFYFFPPAAKSAIGGVFKTHPPMQKRIDALTAFEAQLQNAGR